MKKNLLSGVKPSGLVHLGNYFGAMKQFEDLYKTGQFNMHIMIADYHALNTVQDAAVMRSNIFELALDFLALGLDPKKVVLFKQSDISAHTELTWIFDTLVTVPYLQRAHAFKDAEAKEKEINVGTFNYPVLMAADILLYNTDVVPVGQDQKQHLEYARDIALKYNNAYGETFKLPEPLIQEHVATVPGTDGRKMSKSYNNTIPLFASREEIQKAVMSIVTDSGADIPANVYSIHKLFKTEAELKALYEEHKGKYKALKDALVNDIDAFVTPLRNKRAEFAKNPELVAEILVEGAKKASAVANETLIAVKKAIGVL